MTHLHARTLGRLVELPLTTGRHHAVDPDEIVEIGAKHDQPGVTIVRLRNQHFTLYVKAEYLAVRELVAAALSARSC